jgi:hypothetical protein
LNRRFVPRRSCCGSLVTHSGLCPSTITADFVHGKYGASFAEFVPGFGVVLANPEIIRTPAVAAARL